MVAAGEVMVGFEINPSVKREWKSGRITNAIEKNASPSLSPSLSITVSRGRSKRLQCGDDRSDFSRGPTELSETNGPRRRV